MTKRFEFVVCTLAILAIASAALGKSRYQALLATSSGRATLLNLALLEDGRVTNDGRLFKYLTSDSPLVRLRCVEVIGRIQDPQDAPHLHPLLNDPDMRVVRETVFALGQIGSQASAPKLAEFARGAHPDLRVVIAEALGKIGGEQAIDALTEMAHAFQGKVRAAAVMGLGHAGDERVTDALLLATNDGDDKVVWRAIYALEKVPSKRVTNRILSLLEHDAPVIRAYAARTLGKQKADDAVEKLIELLGDTNERVLINTMNALASILENKQEKKVVEPLGRLMEKHPSHHVRHAAVMTMGAVGDKGAKDYLAQSILDSDRVIRAESFKSLAKVLGKQSVVFLSSGLNDSEPIVRLATMKAYGLAGDNKQLDFLLTTASDDPDKLVRAAAVRALGHFKYDDVSAVLLQKLNDSDWVVATESVTALGEIGDKKAIPSLIARYEMRNDREDKDVRLKILSVLTAMKVAEAESLARGALDDGDKRIRTAGKKLLERIEVEIPEIPGDRHFYERDLDISRKVALSLPMGENRAVIRCKYGTIEIELFGDDATQTVANFIKLARKGSYDGKTFHRVVPNFVVQGGCPRGDGWGDDGYYIRSEFNHFHYGRGAVGIAHSGKDTGGTQFFITHSPQPQLDGRYTIFGRVTKGMDVVDKIHQGDKFQVKIMD